MATLLYALGLLLAAEGLLWALAPQSIESLLAALRDLSVEARRAIGIGALALGVALIWLARAAGAF